MIKINFLGDSITEGAAASAVEKTFVYLVGQKLNAEARNYGKGGTRLAKQIVPSIDPNYDKYFLLRAKSMNHDADYVFVFGGVNDFGHGDAPFGEIGDKTSNTFCGAVEELCDFLLKHYSKNKITFIPPLHCHDESNPCGYDNEKANKPGKTLSEYYEALVKIVRSKDINILDIREEFGPAHDNPHFSPDYLHPSDDGHRFIADLIVDYLKSVL